MRRCKYDNTGSGRRGISRASGPWFLPIWLATLFLPSTNLWAEEASLSNEAYTLTVEKGNSIRVHPAGGSAVVFDPAFTVIVCRDPGTVGWRREYLDEKAAGTRYGYKIPVWRNWDGATEAGDPLDLGRTHVLRPETARMLEGGIDFIYPPQDAFSLSARLELSPQAGDDPRLSFILTAKQDGYFCVAYTGAPQAAPENVDFALQPPVWHEKRFPSEPILSTESMATTPAVLYARDGVITGLTVDPAQVPFRLAQLSDSRYGFMLRNSADQLQPIFVSPLLGLENSHLEPGQSVHSAVRIIHRRGTWTDLFRHIVQGVHGLTDFRRNATCSLNETLENMVEFAMDDHFSGWDPNLKGFAYVEIPGNVKVVSALHALSVALVTDRRDIYSRRALPLMEFIVSREKFGFSSDPATKDHEGPSHYLRGPTAEVGELAVMFTMTGRRTSAFLAEAEHLFEAPSRILNLALPSRGDAFWNALGLFRATGEKRYLEAARHDADAYIARRIDSPQTDFTDLRLERGGIFFASDVFPKWMALLDLYEETGEPKYLEAARKGAMLFLTAVWTVPVPPDGAVWVHEEAAPAKGVWHSPGAEGSRWLTTPKQKPRQAVEAWRVTHVGIAPEAVTTATEGASLLAPHAAYLLRLGHYTEDHYFTMFARHAVIGRYANYPGYKISHRFATAYAAADYPYQLLSKGKTPYNRMYYNHIWPQIALVQDYLFSETFARSKGAVAFPFETALGYAYLTSRVYGHRPGRFYTDEDVWPWMPPRLFRIDNVQVNYVSGRGNGNLYAFFSNEADHQIEFTVTVNSDVAPRDAGRDYPLRVWRDGRPSPGGLLKDGRLRLTLAPRASVGVAIDGLDVTPAFQQSLPKNGTTPLGPTSYWAGDTAVGPVRAMLISCGPELVSAYVYLTETGEQFESVRFLSPLLPDEGGSIVDTTHPFEFSVQLPERPRTFRYHLEAITKEGETLTTRLLELQTKPVGEEP